MITKAIGILLLAAFGIGIFAASAKDIGIRNAAIMWLVLLVACAIFFLAIGMAIQGNDVWTVFR